MKVYIRDAHIFFLTLYLFMQLIQLGNMYQIPKDITEQQTKMYTICLLFTC